MFIPQLLNKLGQVCVKQKCYDDAKIYFSKAIERFPKQETPEKKIQVKIFAQVNIENLKKYF